MYAIVDIAGQQFKVEKGQKIYVHRMEDEEGDDVSFDKVLLIDNEGKISIGQPFLEGAWVEGKVITHMKGDKVIVFKKKRRKGYQIRNGHRQYLSHVEIVSVNETGAPKKGETKAQKPRAEKAVAEKKSEAIAEPKAVKKAEVKAETGSDAKKEAPKKAAAKAPAKKPAAKPAAKTSAKPAAKTSAKPAAKPAAKASAKPAAAAKPKSAAKPKTQPKKEGSKGKAE